ncbi:protein of unknown function [Streptomyces sp. KY75]|nr:protein of unknown function [Streptomyces sp. KY75]CAD5984554.1 protein of unknown function [Streptomyces sp. KY70]
MRAGSGRGIAAKEKGRHAERGQLAGRCAARSEGRLRAACGGHWRAAGFRTARSTQRGACLRDGTHTRADAAARPRTDPHVRACARPPAGARSPADTHAPADTRAASPPPTLRPRFPSRGGQRAERHGPPPAAG